MPARKMEKLVGGETEHLTQNYWAVRAVVFNKKSSDEEVFLCRKNVLPLFNLEEIKYLYWELVHTTARNNAPQRALMKEYLLNEFMDRKYKRNGWEDSSK